MKKILVTGCGGAPTTNFVRSLRDVDPEGKKYYLVGIDMDKYTVQRSECDRSYLGPKASDPRYIPFIKEIIAREGIQYMHTQPEVEVFTIGKNREEILATGCKLFMPRQESIEILRDKFRSYDVWKAAGITVPKNLEINNETDLRKAFEVFGSDIWIREKVGAAGKGSLSRPTFEFALAYITARKGWGVTVAAEHLTARTITWQSLWQDGKLVIAQGRERLSWEMGNRTQSGVTGLTGTGKIVNDPALDQLSQRCITVVDPKPNGIFSVDFTYDQAGIPNPTEINIGKFFTTHNFLSRAGCNMPQILVDLAFGEYRGPYGVLNPCQDDLYWIRGMDIEPVLVDGKTLQRTEDEFNQIMSQLS